MVRLTASLVGSVSLYGIGPLVTPPRTSSSPFAPPIVGCLCNKQSKRKVRQHTHIHTRKRQPSFFTYIKPFILFSHPSWNHGIVGVVLLVGEDKGLPSVGLEWLLHDCRQLRRHFDHFPTSLLNVRCFVRLSLANGWKHSKKRGVGVWVRLEFGRIKEKGWGGRGGLGSMTYPYSLAPATSFCPF